MYHMYAVCASGIGTSLFARRLISESVKELGYNLSDIHISCIGMQEAAGTNADVFITGASIAKNIPDRPGVEKVIVVNMINDREGMKKALAPVLERALDQGKVGRGQP